LKILTMRVSTPWKRWYAGSHRIHVPPVAFRLGVDPWIAVHLRRGGQEEASLLCQGQPQGVQGAQAPHLHGLDGELQVIHGAGGRGEVEHSIQGAGDIQRIRDVLLDEGERRVPLQGGNVVAGSREEVVHPDDLVPRVQETIRQVGAQEPRRARDEDPHQLPGRTGRRPTEWYSNPWSTMRAGL